VAINLTICKASGKGVILICGLDNSWHMEVLNLINCEVLKSTNTRSNCVEYFFTRC